MDRNELLNDQEEAMRTMLDGRQSDTWTAIPGIIEEIDLATMTLSVRPAIKAPVISETGAREMVELPLLLDVPICFPSGGGFILTFPLETGDEVLVVFASRCIDAWWESGSVQIPTEVRMHDLSDGFAIPGPRSLPNLVGSIDADRVQIRNDEGTVFFSVGTKFAAKNATTDLHTLLTQLNSTLNTFMGVLAALPPTPVSGSALSAPATNAQTGLATVSTQINALLEAT